MINISNIQSITDQPLWWLSTGFGKLVFILFFITWGLVIIDLALLAFYLVRSLLKK